MEGSSGGNVKEEYVGGIPYTDHALFIWGDGAVIDGGW